jgi:hypothetical protein
MLQLCVWMVRVACMSDGSMGVCAFAVLVTVLQRIAVRIWGEIYKSILNRNHDSNVIGS